MNASGGDSGRSNLMDEIRRGAQLRPTETRSEGSSHSEEDGRDNLLKQIRDGIRLKKVEAVASQDRNSTPEQMSGIAGALARALAERRSQIRDSEGNFSYIFAFLEKRNNCVSFQTRNS